MSEYIIGIDLGTTNSEVAVVQDGQARVLSVEGQPILPSVVGLNSDGKLLIGTAARNQLILAPDRTIRSIKRQMGRDILLPLGGQSYRPQEISAMILRKLKASAEAELGQPVQKAVITVPAFFNDSQRQATREAGALAGLEVVRILNEPTAAALTYNPNPTGRDCFLVYDLGGGTFDVSIVQAENGVFEVLASQGDTELGGDDFDLALAEAIARDFLELYQVDLLANPASRARILRAAETAKKRLSDHPYVKLEEEFIAEKDGIPLHLSSEWTREQLNELIEPFLQRTMDCVQKALNDARLTAEQMDRVVLVGGSTRTPRIAEMLRERFGHEPDREVHPDLCVALGAAIQGAIIAKQSVSAVLVDITPHSLGVKTVEYPDHYSEKINEFHFSPIVKRNTPLPASRSELFCTVNDHQTRVDIEIFQGESADVRQNHRVGKFTVEGLSRVPAGNQILIQLDVTLDGTLKVSAREKTTGLIKQITIENALARFALEERQAAQDRLERLWQESQAILVDDEDDEDPALPASEDESDWDLDEDGYEFESARPQRPEPTEDSNPSSRGQPAGDRDGDEETDEAAAPRPRFRVPGPPPAGPNPEIQQAEAALNQAERLRPVASPADQIELDQLVAAVRQALAAGPGSKLKDALSALQELLFYLEDQA